MPNTMTLIASSTVGAGGTATVTFSSIPNTYTDLCVFYSARQDTGDLSAFTRFNSDSGANYSYPYIYGDGSSAGGGVSSGQSGLVGWQTEPSSYTSNVFGSTFMYVPNYTSSNAKSVNFDFVSENNATAAAMMLWAGLWSGTSAITSISFTAFSSKFVQYSTFYLYGISKS